MTPADSTRFQFTPDLTICRLLNGMWQVSGAHGYIEPDRAIAEMFAYHGAGLTTWDLADHYGPAEDFVGSFRRQFAARHGVDRLSEIQAFTKWFPHPGRITRRVVGGAQPLLHATSRACAISFACTGRTASAGTVTTETVSPAKVANSTS